MRRRGYGDAEEGLWSWGGKEEMWKRSYRDEKGEEIRRSLYSL